MGHHHTLGHNKLVRNFLRAQPLRQAVHLLFLVLLCTSAPLQPRSSLADLDLVGEEHLFPADLLAQMHDFVLDAGTVRLVDASPQLVTVAQRPEMPTNRRQPEYIRQVEVGEDLDQNRFRHAGQPVLVDDALDSDERFLAEHVPDAETDVGVVIEVVVGQFHSDRVHGGRTFAAEADPPRGERDELLRDEDLVVVFRRRRRLASFLEEDLRFIGNDCFSFLSHRYG